MLLEDIVPPELSGQRLDQVLVAGGPRGVAGDLAVDDDDLGLAGGAGPVAGAAVAAAAGQGQGPDGQDGHERLHIPLHQSRPSFRPSSLLFVHRMSASGARVLTARTTGSGRSCGPP